jgi:hypothetical protein
VTAVVNYIDLLTMAQTQSDNTLMGEGKERRREGGRYKEIFLKSIMI